MVTTAYLTIPQAMTPGEIYTVDDLVHMTGFKRPSVNLALLDMVRRGTAVRMAIEEPGIRNSRHIYEKLR